MSIADTLDKAADLITPEGAWSGGGSPPRHNGCLCAAIAIDEVAGGVGCRTGELAREFFAKFINVGSRDLGIYSWNDAPERTQVEVVAKLHEAASKAREQGL